MVKIYKASVTLACIFHIDSSGVETQLYIWTLYVNILSSS